MPAASETPAALEHQLTERLLDFAPGRSLARKGWAHDPDLLETVADKVKDVRQRGVS